MQSADCMQLICSYFWYRTRFEIEEKMEVIHTIIDRLGRWILSMERPIFSIDFNDAQIYKATVWAGFVLSMNHYINYDSTCKIFIIYYLITTHTLIRTIHIQANMQERSRSTSTTIKKTYILVRTLLKTYQIKFLSHAY